MRTRLRYKGNDKNNYYVVRMYYAVSKMYYDKTMSNFRNIPFQLYRYDI